MDLHGLFLKEKTLPLHHLYKSLRNIPKFLKSFFIHEPLPRTAKYKEIKAFSSQTIQDSISILTYLNLF
jgi:hypothetical protein